MFPIVVSLMQALCLVEIKSSNGKLNTNTLVGDHCRILFSSNLFQILDQPKIWFRIKEQAIAF